MHKFAGPCYKFPGANHPRPPIEPMVRNTATEADSQHSDHNGFGVQRLKGVRCIATTIGFDVFLTACGQNFNITFLESKSSRLAHDSSLPLATHKIRGT